jgi:hypothetical protein
MQWLSYFFSLHISSFFSFRMNLHHLNHIILFKLFVIVTRQLFFFFFCLFFLCDYFLRILFYKILNSLLILWHPSFFINFRIFFFQFNRRLFADHTFPFFLLCVKLRIFHLRLIYWWISVLLRNSWTLLDYCLYWTGNWNYFIGLILYSLRW